MPERVERMQPPKPPWPPPNVRVRPLNPVDYEEIERLSNPILHLKQLDKWRMIAAIAVSLLVAGFSSAVWLMSTFAQRQEVSGTRQELQALTRNVSNLTVQVTKLTTVTAASGKMSDEMRQDIRSIQEDLRKPLRARRPPRDEQASLPSFEEILGAAQMEH